MRWAGLGLASALVLTAASVEAGPWGRGKSGLYLNVSFESLDTTRLATPDGVTQDIPAFELRQVGLYAAYGLTDRYTLLLDRLGFRDSAIEGFDSTSGVEDVRLGLQAQLGTRGPWLFAARGIVQAPTGDATKGSGLLPTGSGAWEGELRLSIGRSSRGGLVYGYGELGHQVRGKGLRDGLVYEGQLGVRAGERVLLLVNLRGVQPYRSEPGEGALTSPAGLGDGVTYTALGPSAIVEIGRGWGAQVELENAFNASNLAVGWKTRVKLFYSR